MIFEKVILCLNKGILPTVPVKYGVPLTGMRSKRYFGCSLLKTLCTKDEVEGVQALILGRFSLSMYL